MTVRSSDDPLDRLERSLGHAFTDRTLLERAMMHASIHDTGQGESYQRLEFLGDRVLGLAVAAILYRRHPEADEGDLARRFNALVRREACADRALSLGIDAALQLGHAEASGGGRKKAAILADACEAALAAVFLDAGFEAAAGVVERVWAPLVEGRVEPARDAKTALQERLQADGDPPPTYRLRARSGPDHKPHFVIEVVSASGVLAAGEGGSKREAEQAAAKKALEASECRS